jgi:hypothetical protein
MIYDSPLHFQNGIVAVLFAPHSSAKESAKMEKEGAKQTITHTEMAVVVSRPFGVPFMSAGSTRKQKTKFFNDLWYTNNNTHKLQRRSDSQKRKDGREEKQESQKGM